MIGIDTNVLIRYLVQDHKEQSAAANRAIEQSHRTRTQIFLNHVVLSELVWVLSRAYKLSKEEIASLLESILLTAQFEFEHKNIVWAALAEYRAKPVDFSDALIGLTNRSQHCSTTLTFDKHAAKIEAFKLIA